MNIDTILTISLAQRQAMRAIRREYPGLSRNAIDLLTYAHKKSFITANQIASKCLFSNTVQAKRTICQLVERNLMLSFARGKKGRPTLYIISGSGNALVSEFLKGVRVCAALHVKKR